MKLRQADRSYDVTSRGDLLRGFYCSQRRVNNMAARAPLRLEAGLPTSHRLHPLRHGVASASLLSARADADYKYNVVER